MRTIFFSCAALLLGAVMPVLSAADFELQKSGQITYKGKVLVKSSSFTVGAKELLEGKTGTFQQLSDGSAVINRSDASYAPYREEVVVNSDGSEIEITFSMRIESDHEAVQKNHPLIYTIKLPWSWFENKNYKEKKNEKKIINFGIGVCFLFIFGSSNRFAY